MITKNNWKKLSEEDLAVAYSLLMGREWANQYDNESCARKMKLILEGRDNACQSIWRFKECIEFLNVCADKSTEDAASAVQYLFKEALDKYEKIILKRQKELLELKEGK